MGQQQIIPYKEYQKQYAMVSKTQNQELLIRHKQTQRQYMLRKVIVNSQQELQQRLKILNRRRKIKSQHLLNIVDFKPIKDDKICGSTTYVSLLIEYPFESVYYETLHRLQYPQTSHKSSTNRVTPLYFQQHQLWSILYSSALGLEALYSSDMVHEGITKSMVLIDKDGGVKIGDPILLGSRTNYEKVIQMIENQKKMIESSSSQGSRNNFYLHDKNNGDLKKLNRGKSTDRKNKKTQEQTAHQNKSHKQSQQTDSVIISPELISFCKDHQSYYYDKEKSDVYVLGAMMVELALLDNVFSFNVKENKLKKDCSYLFVEGSKLKQKYSAAFLDIIQEMINIDPRKRPNLTEIVQKIEEFSIQQNSQSDRYSLKKHDTDSQQINPNQSQNLLNKYIFNDQPLTNYGAKISDMGYGNQIQYKTGNVSQYTQFPTYNFNKQFGLQTNQPLKMQSIPYQFPSFSVQKDPLINNLTTKPLYEESAVKSLFSNRLPFEIKYVQSPLIIPVSNVRGRGDIKDSITGNQQTPFHNLNLTESNQKWIKKQYEKQSIVKQKITLFGPNINTDQLMTKIKGQQPTINNTNQRFSLNNFGKIELTNNLSNQNSVNTSMIPTPRFENPFSSQSIPKLSEVNKSMFHYHPPLSTFNTEMNSSYGVGESYQKHVPLQTKYVPIQTQYNVTNNLTSSLNNYPNIHTKQGPMISSYDPKKQGFSISQDIKQSQISASVNKDAEPYFSNSSVGYTLPKYRPQSTSSQVIKSVSQQKSRCSSANNPKSQIHNHPNTSRTQNAFKDAESFLQRVDSSPNQIQAYHQKKNNNDTTPVLSQLMNEKQQTYSISSSQNTIRKNNQNSFKNSGKKKYNFYKKELNQQLQKINTPSPAQSEQILLSTSIRQNQLSSTKKEQQKGMKKQQSKIKIKYEPQSHSVYVEQKQSNGSFYRGFKLNNQRHGFGTLIFADSGFYQGQFYQNKMQGQGKLYYNQHDLAYQGQFLHNSFHGHGILYNNNPQKLQGRFDFANMGNICNYWIKYDGFFKEDQKSGKCHLYLTNGEQFQGFCQNNTFDGNGKFKTIQGDEIEGIWRNNVLIEIKNQTKAFDLQK